MPRHPGKKRKPGKVIKANGGRPKLATRKKKNKK